MPWRRLGSYPCGWKCKKKKDANWCGSCFQGLLTPEGPWLSTRWRCLTLSLPVERGSIFRTGVYYLISIDERCDCHWGSRCASIAIFFLLSSRGSREKQNVPFSSPWMCNTSRFMSKVQLHRCRCVAPMPPRPTLVWERPLPSSPVCVCAHGAG